MNDKYGVEIECGDTVVVCQINSIRNFTFDRGIIERIYTVTDGRNFTDIAEVNIGKIVSCGETQIISVRG